VAVETEGTVLIPGSVWMRLAVAVLLSAAVLGVLVWKRALGLRDADDEPEALRRVSPLVWVAGAFTLYIGVYTVGLGLATLIGMPEGEPIRSAAVQVIGVYGFGIAVCVAGLVVLGRVLGAERFGIDAGGAGFGLLAFAAAAPALLLVADAAVIVRTLVVGTPPDPIAHSTLEQIVSSPGDPLVWVIIFGAVVGAPVFEEMVFRGLLQTGLMRALRSRWAAIVVTAVVFALTHRMGTTPVPWHALAPIFMVGIVCGYAAEKRGVLAAMVAHASFNASQVGLALVLVV